MAWSRKLSSPITLDDGRRFVRLRDAAEFALKLSDRQKANPDCRYAVRLLKKAAALMRPTKTFERPSVSF